MVNGEARMVIKVLNAEYAFASVKHFNDDGFLGLLVLCDENAFQRVADNFLVVYSYARTVKFGGNSASSRTV